MARLKKDDKAYIYANTVCNSKAFKKFAKAYVALNKKKEEAISALKNEIPAIVEKNTEKSVEFIKNFYNKGFIADMPYRVKNIEIADVSKKYNTLQLKDNFYEVNTNSYRYNQVDKPINCVYKDSELKDNLNKLLVSKVPDYLTSRIDKTLLSKYFQEPEMHNNDVQRVLKGDELYIEIPKIFVTDHQHYYDTIVVFPSQLIFDTNRKIANKYMSAVIEKVLIAYSEFIAFANGLASVLHDTNTDNKLLELIPELTKYLETPLVSQNTTLVNITSVNNVRDNL